MFSFLCSWDDSSSVSSGLSDTLDNLSTDDLNTASSVSSYSNITASSRKNTHAQVSSFVAICCNIPIQDRKSLVSMHLNEWGIHILQNPLLHLDARSHRLHWPNLGLWADILNSLLPGFVSLLKVVAGETQLCPPWVSSPGPSPCCTLTQSKHNMIGSVIMDFYSFQLIWSISSNRQHNKK